MDLEADLCVLIVGLFKLLSMKFYGSKPIKGYISPGVGDVNPVIENITTA